MICNLFQLLIAWLLSVLKGLFSFIRWVNKKTWMEERVKGYVAGLQMSSAQGKNVVVIEARQGPKC